MKTLTVGKKKVEIYDSIREMPINRYNTMQGLLLQEAGIGSTMFAIENHFKSLDVFLSSNLIEDAIKERQNLHLSFYCALEKIDFRSLSFACMIFRIDEKEVGISEDALKGALESLPELTIGQVSDILEEVKKNCIEN
jgi:hypothetical protein